MIWLVLILAIVLMLTMVASDDGEIVKKLTRPKQKTSKIQEPKTSIVEEELDEMTVQQFRKEINDLRSYVGELQRQLESTTSRVGKLTHELDARLNELNRLHTDRYLKMSNRVPSRDRLTVGVRTGKDQEHASFGELSLEVPFSEHVIFVQNLWLPKNKFITGHNGPGAIDTFGPSATVDRFAYLGVHKNVTDSTVNSFGVIVSSTIGFSYRQHGIEKFSYNNIHYGFVWLYGVINGTNVLFASACLPTQHIAQNDGSQRMNPVFTTDKVAKLLTRLHEKLPQGKGTIVMGGGFGMSKTVLLPLLQQMSSEQRYKISNNIASFRIRQRQYSYDYVVTSGQAHIAIEPKVIFRPYGDHAWLTECETLFPINPQPNMNFGENFTIEQ